MRQTLFLGKAVCSASSLSLPSSPQVRASFLSSAAEVVEAARAAAAASSSTTDTPPDCLAHINRCVGCV